MSSEERAWVSLAEHFLDTETRHELPSTALACVEAGFDVGAMKDALYGRVAPEVGSNLLSVAGEWAGWDDAALIEAIRRRGAPSRFRKAASRALPGLRQTAESIARFMRLFEATPSAERRAVWAAV
jgi:hypothetical protein